MPERKAARDPKSEQFDAFTVGEGPSELTTDQGVPLPQTDDSLKAGTRGPSLIEDFHLREKITHFDHERIPERVVHARGAAAHGVFRVYRSLAEYTRAAFLQDPEAETPVFVRFSTVVGSRGSADTARDVRGFATKFYTSEGNFDLVGNNMPVFFIQDGMKFPDLVHAVKPEPDVEIPQASSAHDSFFDFVSLAPETAHMLMWVMSDRGIPRSFRMMEGFGVHTFRLVNAAGESRFVKFHWKPVLGMASLVWDEAVKLAGADPDVHRRDLRDSIDAGAFPEWELGLQVFDEQQAATFPFDILDPTKLIPEELVPVEIVGRMTLNRNPANFFSETEQAAFHVANVVPGIDVTNDPLMQARLFSYLDTQLTRLGGPNFAELPINRPVAPVQNHQQDGFARQTINARKANYHPNSLSEGMPQLAPQGYTHFPQPVSGTKTREREAGFRDFFSQATLFYRSQAPVEQDHVIAALQFELARVRFDIRERTINEILANIDIDLARRVATAVNVPEVAARSARGAAPPRDQGLERSAALSIVGNLKEGVATKQVAILAGPGSDAAATSTLMRGLAEAGTVPVLIAAALGPIGDGGVEATKTFDTAKSVMFDGVLVPGGGDLAELAGDDRVLEFVRDAFRHYKTLGFGEGAERLLTAAGVAGSATEGVIVEGAPATLAEKFLAALAQHRHWRR